MFDTNRRHILELLAAAANNRSTATFLTANGARDATFADLWALSSRIAHALEAYPTDGRVAGVLTPSPEMVACFVASLRTGRDFVSLPLPGRGQRAAAYAAQQQAIVELSQVCSVVVESAYRPLFESLPVPLPCPVIEAERLAESQTDTSYNDRIPGHLIQFSSGTTGAPKGVRISGEAILACVEALLKALGIGGRPEVYCGWVPLSHDMGLIGGLLTTWVGATRAPYRYICISPELFLTRPSVWLQRCSLDRATITTAPTFAYQVVASQLHRGPALDLTSLRAAILGAEPISPETLQAFSSAAFRHGFRETALCPAYGLAEATLAVSLVPPAEHWSTRTLAIDGHTNTYVSCGRILDCIAVDAPDERAGAGPIRIAGSAFCSGYLPPRQTSPDGWFDTGDLGVVVDDELFVTGRSDDLLCLAGRNVFAWELERAVCELPQVRPGNCAVVADGQGRYVALFEPRTTLPADLDVALSEVRRKLVSIAGIGPLAVGCLPRGTLPKTASGKITRNGIKFNLRQFIDSCLTYKEW